MPNHTANLLEIHGDKETIQRLIAEVSDNGKGFDFNKIVPMPESLQITAGSSTDYGIAVLKWQKNKDPSDLKDILAYPWVKSEGINNYDDLAKFLVNKGSANLVEGQKALDNIKNYGCKDWYSWACSNWGTKWNSYDNGEWNIGVNDASIYFETAWSPPMPVIHALSVKYPTLKFKISYADEGGGFLGYTTFKNGKSKEKEFKWYENGTCQLTNSGRKLLNKLGRGR